MSVKQKNVLKYAGGLLAVLMLCIIPLISYANAETDADISIKAPGLTEENLPEETLPAPVETVPALPEDDAADSNAAEVTALTAEEGSLAGETGAAGAGITAAETAPATEEATPEPAKPVEDAVQTPETQPAADNNAPDTTVAAPAIDEPAAQPETTTAEPTVAEPAVNAQPDTAGIETPVETTLDTTTTAETPGDADSLEEPAAIPEPDTAAVISETEETQVTRRARDTHNADTLPAATETSDDAVRPAVVREGDDAGVTSIAGSGGKPAEQPETQSVSVKGQLEDRPSTLTATGSDTIVEAYGMGASREFALQAALMEAIGKVNGTTLTNTEVEQLRYQLDAVLNVSGDKNRTGGVEGKESLQYGLANQVDFVTNGLVKSYEVISEGRVNKEYEISIRAVVAKYTPGVAAQRQRIAVMPFRILNASGWQALYAEFFTQHLVDYLAQTNRFAVVDRKYMAEKQSEFAILNSPDTPVAERVRIGNTLGADYMVTGQINKVEYWLTEEKLPYLNSMQYTLTAKTSFNMRVIEPATGMVVMSKTYDEKTELKFDGREGLKLEDVEQAEIDKLAAAAAEKAGQNIINEVYPVMAIAYSPDGMFTINQGGDTIKASQQYNLRVYGEMLVDPYTKEELGRSEKTIGLVEITEVMPRFALAKALELSTMADLEALVAGHNVILRPVAKPEAPAKTPPPPAKNQPKW